MRINGGNISPYLNELGFTLIELIALVSIISVILMIGMPKTIALGGQLRASDDIRKLAHVLGEMRSTAKRLRTTVRVSFATHGYSWDVDDDSTVDGYLELSSSSSWAPSVPQDLLFNGLGLVRNITGERTIAIENGGINASLTINSNGYISF